MSIDLKALTFKVTKEMDEQLQAEAQRRETTVSHILRLGVEAYFQGEGARQQNMKTLMERIDRLEYEVICLRSMLGRSYSNEEYDVVMKLAHEEAAAYVEGLKNGK